MFIRAVVILCVVTVWCDIIEEDNVAVQDKENVLADSENPGCGCNSLQRDGGTNTVKTHIWHDQATAKYSKALNEDQIDGGEHQQISDVPYEVWCSWMTRFVVINDCPNQWEKKLGLSLWHMIGCLLFFMIRFRYCSIILSVFHRYCGFYVSFATIFLQSFLSIRITLGCFTSLL